MARWRLNARRKTVAPDRSAAPILSSCREVKLDELQLEFAAEDARGLERRIKLNLVVIRIENALQLTTARAHPPRHFVLGHSFLSHRVLKLPCEHTLDRNRARFLVQPFVLHKVVEGRTDAPLL